MQASTLIRVARDLAREYDKFSLPQLLQQTVNLASARPALQPQAYNEQRATIQSAAKRILTETVFRAYPTELRAIVDASDYGSALPERFAHVLSAAFPDNAEDALTSPEARSFLNLANRVRGELNQLLSAAAKFHVQPIEVPPDEIGLDVCILREAVQDKPTEMTEVLTDFVDLMSAFIELTTGSREPPHLVYTTTSDIIFGLSMGVSAALGVLGIYKLYLDLTIKRLTIRNLRRELRELKPDEGEAEGMGDLSDWQKTLIEGAVRKAVAAVQTDLTTDRVHEVRNELGLKAPQLLFDLERGTRVNITIESLSNFDELAAKAGADVALLKANLDETRKLETQVVQARTSLNASRRIAIQEQTSATVDGASKGGSDTVE